MKGRIDNLAEIISEEDDEMLALAEEELAEITKKIESTYIITLLNGKYDNEDAYLEFHSGAGGEESQDWTDMLLRMYLKFFDRAGYKAEVLDTDRDGAGLKNATVRVSGEFVYGKLKGESGVHRLVRISPFDSNKRRHTSFSSVKISPILSNVENVEISSDDIRVETYRSGGAGGQHVNKTDSAVRITHIKTGIVVQCQNERSQIQNRAAAMAVLSSKLQLLAEEERSKEIGKAQGDIEKNEWGSQIRSYVFCPYQMVKDHRTNYSTSDIAGVMDGELEAFVEEYLKRK